MCSSFATILDPVVPVDLNFTKTEQKKKRADLPPRVFYFIFSLTKKKKKFEKYFCELFMTWEKRGLHTLYLSESLPTDMQGFTGET